ncbi:MAG: efflux RND transporter periplasmic adaptor subunit [Bacteroidaceae bacterium]|nr:efflux RND transporter periplasmic adaptor subunit [Bacteroidaceae bacterium]
MKRTLFLAAVATMALSGCKNEAQFTCEEEVVVKQDIVTSITATGTIEPVTSVDVGTQVSGIVSKLYVDYNSEVKAGQVIAELDRTNLLSELESAQANLRSAESDLAYQKLNYQRYSTLYHQGLISTNDYDKTKLSYDQSVQTVNQRRENVKKAQTNLGYATITSPINGVVLSKEVEEGQTVAASFNTPTLFKIAQDLTQMRVIADVDEADIGEVREGQRVTFTVDAFPDDVFSGTVSQVRQQATTTSNVVTYQVVISAPNDDLKLKPGLTANATIYTMELKDAVAVPSKALRFNPNPEMLNEDEEIKDNTDSKTKVWVKEGNIFKSVAVTPGTSNGLLTEIKSGLTPGMKVVVSCSSSEEPEMAAQNNNPFMPKRKDRNKDKKEDK